MFKILFRYLISQPNFLKLHVKNLTEFVLNEIEKSFISYKKKLILRALSIFFIGSGILSILLSVLLWGALPQLNPNNSWILIAQPVLLLVIGAILYWISTNKRTESIFRIIVVKTKTETQLFLDSLRK
jgi:TM2 domain-containing membrane protein YozV